MNDLIDKQPQGEIRTCQVCDEKQILKFEVSYKHWPLFLIYVKTPEKFNTSFCEAFLCYRFTLGFYLNGVKSTYYFV